MNHHQFLHLLNSASVLISCRNIMITNLHGLWALLGALDRPAFLNEYFEKHDGIDVSFFRGDDEDYACVTNFLNAAMGKDSPYHEHYGCYLTARTPWDSPLPDGWFQSESLAYLNVCLRHGTAVSITPEHHALLALINNEHPLLMMQLLATHTVNVSRLQDVIRRMPFNPTQRWAVNKRLLDLARSVELDGGDSLDRGASVSSNPERTGNVVVPITMRGTIKKPPKKAVVASSWALHE